MIKNAIYVINPKSENSILGYEKIQLIERRFRMFEVLEQKDEKKITTKGKVWRVFSDYEWICKDLIDNDLFIFQEDELFEALLSDYQYVETAEEESQ